MQSRLIRVRYSPKALAGLDDLVDRVGHVANKDVARAAVIRALSKLGAVHVPVAELVAAVKADTVRRGRKRGVPQSRRP